MAIEYPVLAEGGDYGVVCVGRASDPQAAAALLGVEDVDLEKKFVSARQIRRRSGRTGEWDRAARGWARVIASAMRARPEDVSVTEGMVDEASVTGWVAAT